jgi:MFS family permease
MAIAEQKTTVFNAHRVIFRSLRYRNYRLFFMGQIVSLIGTWMQNIALPWLVYRLTDSPLLLGVVGFSGQIASCLLAPLAGVLSDRHDRYRIVIMTQALSMLQALVLAFLFFAGLIHIWHIVLLAVFSGIVNAFDMPARQAFVIQMVDNREDLGNAIALNSMMFNSARLIGPTIAGVVIAATNEGWCFIINGLSYIFVIASLLMMKVSPRDSKRRAAHLMHELKEGLLYAAGLAPIRYLMLLLAMVSLVGMPYVVLMPVFASRILHGGPHTFGFLMASGGTGALVGALYLASRRNIGGLINLVPLATAVFGAGLIVFSFSRLLWLSMPLMFVMGLGMIMQMAASNTIIQTVVDDDKRGRIMSLHMMAFIGTAPFGSLLAGWLASSIGAPGTFRIGGTLCLLSAMVFASRLPFLHRTMRLTYSASGAVTEGDPAAN